MIASHHGPWCEEPEYPSCETCTEDRRQALAESLARIEKAIDDWFLAIARHKKGKK